MYVAWVLGRSNAELLVGRPLPRDMREAVRAELLSVPQVEAVLDLTTLIQGPGEALVAAKIDFRDGIPAEEVERACERRRSGSARVPAVRRVYLDPTPGRGRRGPERERAR